jgi:hypothetical protein
MKKKNNRFTITNLGTILGVKLVAHLDRHVITWGYRKGLRGKNDESQYCFTFNMIEDGKRFNNYQLIMLNREPNENGLYGMFVMGLQSYTQTFIRKSDIRSKEQLLHEMHACLYRAKYWWEHEAHQNAT